MPFVFKNQAPPVLALLNGVHLWVGVRVGFRVRVGIRVRFRVRIWSWV